MEFEEYKDSGIEWIGKVPKHWRCEHLKRVCLRIQTGTTPPTENIEYYDDGTIPWFSPGSYNGGIYLEEPAKLINEVAQRDNKLRMFPAQSIFLVGIGATIGKVAMTRVEASCNQQITGIVCNFESLPKYMTYQFKIYEGIIPQISKYTTLPIMDQVKISYLRVAIPPLAEQRRIAAYLDKTCYVIDSAIEKKQKQLETLDALRKSIIHKAVTRGLDDSVELKDSGIEWIGQVPSHWKVKRIKRYAQVKRGASPRPIADPIYFDDDGEYAWVRIADVSASGRYLEKTTQTLSELGASLSVKQYPGDLIISIAGTVGKPIITKIKCCIHDGFIWFDNPSFNKDYVYFIFMSEAPYQGLGKLGTQLNLNTDTIGQIFIPEPPKTEVDAIVSFLSKETVGIDALKDNINAQIMTLEQYRKSLIHECVTGKRRITEAHLKEIEAHV